MAKILLSMGPIPAKLDSVKYLTNRFKGGLAYKTALELQEKYGHDVTIIKWKYAEPKTSKLNIIDVEDIMDYREKVLAFEADVYVLAAAIANLMPSNPWETKFPSHEYKVGEKFDIQFEIAPRIIDEVKVKYPRAGLVGYKLLDGSDEELVKAGFETLVNSKSNIVFANHPAWAKERKIMLTSDGSQIDVSFDEHTAMIDKLANADYYKTTLSDKEEIICDLDTLKIIENYPKDYNRKIGLTFGTFAQRSGGGFITTSRGKLDKGITKVTSVDHANRKIKAVGNKATLNAPLLDIIFKNNPKLNILIHGHKKIDDGLLVDYEFPGTYQEVEKVKSIKTGRDNIIFNIEHHGYIAGFNNIDNCMGWLKENE